MPWAIRPFRYTDFKAPDARVAEHKISPAVAFRQKKVSAREVRMACIRLPAMPRSTAEDALIDLWVLLEKYGLETPALSVMFQPDGRISLSLIIKEPATTARLYRGWARQWRQRNRPDWAAEFRGNGSPLAAAMASAG